MGCTYGDLTGNFGSVGCYQRRLRRSPTPGKPYYGTYQNTEGEKIRKSKANACLFVAVSPIIFTRIMSLKMAKSIWDYLKEEYAGDERIKGMKVLNLIREFEIQKMKDSEKVKECADRLFNIANEDMANISLSELLNAFQAQEQRRQMREDTCVEGALAAKHKNNSLAKHKKKQFIDGNGATFKCWRRPNAKCSRCNQLGHETVICKEKFQQQEDEAQVAGEEDIDKLFVASCFASSHSSEWWLIDSGCTNHIM
ncbi:hypothetical protein C2S51_006990 [Perilla frutescens var. frutescens]|nr:hypothetical protein C2S51_006990 [Perilla frutescens var. frutescens]